MCFKYQSGRWTIWISKQQKSLISLHYLSLGCSTTHVMPQETLAVSRSWQQQLTVPAKFSCGITGSAMKLVVKSAALRIHSCCSPNPKKCIYIRLHYGHKTGEYVWNLQNDAMSQLNFRKLLKTCWVFSKIWNSSDIYEFQANSSQISDKFQVDWFFNDINLSSVLNWIWLIEFKLN